MEGPETNNKESTLNVRRQNAKMVGANDSEIKKLLVATQVHRRVSHGPDRRAVSWHADGVNTLEELGLGGSGSGEVPFAACHQVGDKECVK